MAKVDFLEKRAEEFFENAKELFKKGVYPLAAFNLQQAAQLYLKYYLFLKLKKYPKVHLLGELLKGIGKVYKKEKEVEEIIEKNANIISDLNQAYFTSRYLPAEFFKSQIERMLKFVEELINFLKKCEKK
jgi:HEPN domain-containing protein